MELLADAIRRRRLSQVARVVARLPSVVPDSKAKVARRLRCRLIGKRAVVLSNLPSYEAGDTVIGTRSLFDPRLTGVRVGHDLVRAQRGVRVRRPDEVRTLVDYARRELRRAPLR